MIHYYHGAIEVEELEYLDKPLSALDHGLSYDVTEMTAFPTLHLSMDRSILFLLWFYENNSIPVFCVIANNYNFRIPY